jgi:mRNA export factor
MILTGESKYWDTRQSTPIASVDMPDRVYAMDIAPPLLVVGTAERHIIVFDLKNPTTPYKVSEQEIEIGLD